MATDLLPGWQGLEVRHVAAFQTVARTGSFMRAALELGYTQSAVTQQIQALERIAGQRLLERSSGRSTVTLTEAGALLLGHFDGITARLGAARSDLDALATGAGGTLRVGAFQSVSARIVPDLLLRLAATSPDTTLDLLEEDDDRELFDRLEAGALDFAFVLLPVDPDRFESVELLRDPYFLIAAEGSAGPLGSLDELEGVPLIGARSCRSHAALESAIEATGVHPRFVFRSDDNTAIQGLVQRGLGVALVPRLALQTMSEEGLETFPADHVVPPRLIALAWSRHRVLRPAQEAFVEAARATCAALQDGSATVLRPR